MTPEEHIAKLKEYREYALDQVHIWMGVRLKDKEEGNDGAAIHSLRSHIEWLDYANKYNEAIKKLEEEKTGAIPSPVIRSKRKIEVGL